MITKRTAALSVALATITILSVPFFVMDMFSDNSENISVLEAEAALPSKVHNITMDAVELPDGLFAYKMASHTITENGQTTDVTQERYGANAKPTIPGPTIIITEGDIANVTLVNKVTCDNFPDFDSNGVRQSTSSSRISLHVHGVHYSPADDGTPLKVNGVEESSVECLKSGQNPTSKTYTWTAAPGSEGAWPYHDHTFLSETGAEDRGLFGALIVNPANNKQVGYVGDDGQIKKVDLSQVNKDIVLWMVSSDYLGESIFYGMEIDNDLDTNGDGVGKQTALWTNPPLLTDESDLVRFHVLGLGDDMHEFHMHGHKWIEEGTNNIIDTFEIGPLQRLSFIIKAGQGVGDGNWMYHCHVFEHMENGMSGMMKVVDAGSSDDDTLPTIGAVITISDEPGLWFKTLDGGLNEVLDPRDGIGFPLNFLPGYEQSEGRSLAITTPGQTVLFNMKDSETVHTITSLIWPEGASGFPFDKTLTIRGSTFLTDANGIPMTLDTPGLYVFTCKIHPYMFGAVLVDQDGALPFDLGPAEPSGLKLLANVGGVFPATIGTASSTATTLLTTFFIVTDPANWKDYSQPNWTVELPPVSLQFNDGTLITNNVNELLGVSNAPISTVTPVTSGVGEVWINTQFEKTLKKDVEGTQQDMFGTITVVDVNDWSVQKKIALPNEKMNHPHNMWIDENHETVYQTQWFDTRMVAIDYTSGEAIKQIEVGQTPSHVMTAPDTGKIYIAMNGEESVKEFDQNSFELLREISVGTNSHPHGHWISQDGRYIVTPNFFTNDAAIIDLSTDPPTITKTATGAAPIATGMMPDGSKFYTADFLGNSFTVIDTSTGAVLKTVDILGDTGAGLPIQTPVSPDGRWMVTAQVLGSKVTVLETTGDTIVATLDCDPGCHGVQWGAKDGGGYYAYVSSKFSNAMTVVDPDPNNDGNGADAAVVGRILLTEGFNTTNDDRPFDHLGMGGQGVLAVPNVYNGWIDNTVASCGTTADPCSQKIVDFLNALTPEQKNATPAALAPVVEPEPTS